MDSQNSVFDGTNSSDDFEARLAALKRLWMGEWVLIDFINL